MHRRLITMTIFTQKMPIATRGKIDKSKVKFAIVSGEMNESASFINTSLRKSEMQLGLFR